MSTRNALLARKAIKKKQNKTMRTDYLFKTLKRFKSSLTTDTHTHIYIYMYILIVYVKFDINEK